MASSSSHPPPEVFYEVLRALSVTLEAQGALPEAQGAEPETANLALGQGASRPVMLIDEADWRKPIIDYIQGGEPEDPAEARRLKHRSRNYHIIKDDLY